MLVNIDQTDKSFDDFDQFASFHPEIDSVEEETSKAADRSFFSHFITQSSLHSKKILLKLLELTLKDSKKLLKAHSFYKLKENMMNFKSEYRCIPSSKSLEEDDCVESPNSYNNPQVGFLALESKFSLMEKASAGILSNKELNKQLFILKLQNQQLKRQVHNLKEEVAEALRRQLKEVSKKQESLEMLMEELQDKNDFIDELKSSVSFLESKMKSKKNGLMSSMLDEDKECLKRTINRLEMVNDRLNHNLEQARNKVNNLDQEHKISQIRCNELQNEIKKLKQINFDLEADREAVEIMRKEASTFSKHFSGKIEKVRKLEKKLSLVAKSIQSETSLEFRLESQSETKTAESCSIRRSNSVKQQIKEETAELKLEAVLNFLFNIGEEAKELQHEDLFEDEEKELLKTHKQLYKNRGHSLERDNFVDHSGLFGLTLDEALNSHDHNADMHDRKKIAKLENECQNLISKICSLKEKQLYYRSVIFNLLKSVDLRSMKMQTESMVSLICDMFEYSESERSSIFKPKSHKLFGIL